MGSCSRTQLYQNFLACHQKHFASGTLAPCSGQEQLRLGKDFLDSVPAPCQRFQRLDFYRLARDYVAGQAGRQQLLPAMGKAFELLELISLNLYLWPWRKEIKSIKTFTGAFVYFIQPVFPPDVLQGILEKMGYTRKGTSDYVMSKQVSKEEIGQLGFEFFLARAECELMQETLDRAMQSGCEDILQVRSSQSHNQADCIKYLKGKEAGPRGMAEELALGNEGASKSGLRPEENLAKSELPSTPLLLTDVNHEGTLGLRVEALDRESDATNDPLSTSPRLPLDSLDLYREYTDITISANIRYPETQKLVEAASPDGKPEQCDYPLILDESLMQKARTEALVKLSPGQTGPLSLSLFPDSTPIATSSESKNLKSKERSPFDTIDPKCSVRHSVLDATNQIYPDDKRSSKNSQKLDGTSSVKYGSFLNDAANSRKRDYVEIELKKIDKEKLPYPIAETAGPAPFLQANHFQTLESQRVELRHPEPTGVKPHGQTQTLRQVPACQTPNIPECCVCAPSELLGVRPLLDDPELAGNTPQDVEDQIVREPPQSFYIPPSSLEGLPSSAMSCDNCRSPICSSCNSRLSAGHGQVMSRDCLQIQELMIGGGTDPYLYVTKLTDKNISLDDDMSVRCNRCNEEEDI
ncbi:uncharacterized protein LOC144492467 [Mustelus asterias]